MRAICLALLVPLASPFATGCAGKPPKVLMTVDGNVPDAAVIIDDKYVGTLEYLNQRGVGLREGQHRITVEASGYFPWDKLIDAQLGKRIELDVQLEPIPD